MSGFDEMDVDTIWMNGEFVDWDEAKVHVLTHALHYGSGVFEGVRAYDTDNGPAIFRWEEHLERLYNSCKPYDLEIEYTPEELTEAVTELLDRQDLASCYIRPLAYYGYDTLGVSPGDCPTDVTIAAWPWGRLPRRGRPPERRRGDGLLVAQALLQPDPDERQDHRSLRQLHARWRGSPPQRLRRGHRPEQGGQRRGGSRREPLPRPGRRTVHARPLREHPRRHHPRDGHYAGRGARLHRPRQRLHLPGRTQHRRRTVLHRQRRRGHPIRKVDNVEIGDGGRGPVTEELQTAFFDLVEAGEREEWFHYV